MFTLATSTFLHLTPVLHNFVATLSDSPPTSLPPHKLHVINTFVYRLRPIMASVQEPTTDQSIPRSEYEKAEPADSAKTSPAGTDETKHNEDKLNNAEISMLVLSLSVSLVNSESKCATTDILPGLYLYRRNRAGSHRPSTGTKYS
jgi:hypothetical protein